MIKAKQLKKYDVVNFGNDILLIKNFLSKDNLNYCLSTIASAKEEDWGKDYVDGLKREALQKFGDSDYQKYVDENLMTMNSDWVDKSIEINEDVAMQISQDIQALFKTKTALEPMRTVQRHYPGSFLKEHVDAEHDPSLIYACVIYLNDNFNGGNLYFPKLGVTIRPVTGALAIFPTGDQYLHGVSLVEPGPTRYALTGFIFSDSV
jgi:Rps23 Pro-64 3,4-dihydroxylase Tpa1-like proline 4-hydroxylase